MSNLFKSPFYFFICAIIGFAAWSFTFNSELNDKNYFANLKTHESNFASLAPEELSYADVDGRRIILDENNEPVADERLLQELQLSKDEWKKKSDEPYVTSPFEVEQYENTVDKSYGEKNQFVDFMQIAAEAPKVQYEDEKSCGAARLAVDVILKKNKSVSELIKETSEESKALPRKCLVHVMNSFALSSNYMAKCPGGIISAPVRGASKPCVSKTLVNVTYNSFVDVTSCLGVNPKSLIPKQLVTSTNEL